MMAPNSKSKTYLNGCFIIVRLMGGAKKYYYKYFLLNKYVISKA